MIKTTNTTAEEPITIICESSKHWSSYIIPIISMCFGIFILLLGTMEEGMFSTFLLIIGVIKILYALSEILKIKSVHWILTDEGVTIKSGFLPWNKIYFEIPMMEIYESYYDDGGFWGSLLGKPPR